MNHEITGSFQKRPEGAPLNGRPGSRHCYAAIVIAVIIFFGLIRYRLRELPLERDEGEYALAGQLILQGVPPYQLAYSMKLPGTYAAYAAILAIFGATPAGVHLGLLAVNAVTILLVYLLAAHLFGRMAGVVAGASYALLSTSPSVLGMAGHATHFVVLPALAGILLLLKAFESGRRLMSAWGGALLGLAFIMKQPGIFFAFFAALYIVYRECRQKPPNWRGAARHLGAFLFGLILPFGLTCLVLAAAGTFGKFWFWTFSYAHEYGSMIGAAEGLRIFWRTFPEISGPALLIWVLAGLGLALLWWDRAARANAVFLTGFLLFSSLAVCPGFYFRSHYFILVLPAAAFLAGVAVISATRMLGSAVQSKVIAAIPMALFVIGFAHAIFQQRAFLFELSPLEACRAVYGPNPFPEALKIAEYIKTHSSPGDRIAVLGSEPEIYFYSGRQPATGYIYVYSLMENQKYALTMQEEMISEIEAARPKHLVLAQVPTSWLVQRGSHALIFSWARQYLRRQYELEGIADIRHESQYAWGDAAKEYSPQSQFLVSAYKRNIDKSRRGPAP